MIVFSIVFWFCPTAAAKKRVASLFAIGHSVVSSGSRAPLFSGLFGWMSTATKFSVGNHWVSQVFPGAQGTVTNRFGQTKNSCVWRVVFFPALF